MGFSTTEDEVDIALYALSHIRDRDGVRTVTLPPARPVEPPREETVQAASDKCYHVDRLGFLVNPQEWDERFAQGIAHELGIQEDLTDDHWKIVRFLRAETAAKGQCPLVYHTCKKNGISLEDLQRLFPTGYLRGACKIAGVTYRDEVIDEPPAAGEEGTAHPAVHDKTYPVNARGFLVSPTDWDETFAICKAAELGIVGTLTEKHWRVIHHLRECWDRARKVPTIFEACSECSITLDEMERLFPTGYHRGAVKIAGLHVL